MDLRTDDILKELKFRASRSSGSGGQHVNKVSTRITLEFDVTNSLALSDQQRLLIMKRLASRISQEGIFQLSSDEDRSQLRNREKAIDKFIALLSRAVYVAPVRKASKPTRSSVEKRLEKKNIQAKKKINRRKDFL